MSGDALPEDSLVQLLASLKALASEPSDQLALFPESVGKAGDLATRFESTVRGVCDDGTDQLSQAQADALEALGQRLAIMSRDGVEFDVDLWTDEALRTSAQWRDVRALARAALDAFEIPNADAVRPETD